MSRASRQRASREAEYREAEAAYRETGKKDHAVWRFSAMRSKDMTDSDFKRAMEHQEGVAEDRRQHDRELIKKFRMEPMRPEPEEK